MDPVQPGILADVPAQARYLTFELAPDTDPGPALHELAGLVDGVDTVVGIGASVAMALGREIPGLRTFPTHTAPGIDVPSTPAALWCWLRGDDRGELVHRTRQIEAVLGNAFRPEDVVDAFRYGSGLDLSGYEDGTENPKDEAALAAGVVRGAGPGLDGSSFVAVQKWIHDLGHFQSMSPETRDHTFGRRISDNEEIDDAPESAHVKRTAQESFTPEAFVVRRSMPWADATGEGLVFVSFGKNLDAFEALLARMVGAEDGVIDALFGFTRPATGATFWCPPVVNGRLDLSALGL
ncbi:MAG: Dyp-type peroxidase [Planctomycetota bacterium]